jgi:EAL domain-containing protein (putative c-di-GMP-specific phosphodiesterase class I)
VPPAIFLPLAQDSGVLARIGSWVLQAACQELAHWAAQPGLQDLTLAVNVGVDQILHEDFADDLQQALQDSGAVPGRLVIEVGSRLTEHDPAGLLACARRVADLGCDQLQGYLYSRPLPVAELLGSAVRVHAELVELASLAT